VLKVNHKNGVPVANEVSDLCGESLNAANEVQSKSKVRFDDTGLVAAVCHHDCIWYLINMTEAGEKQYYIVHLT
jgi:Kyakuja-Dileera-Zisupton transposase